MLALPVKIALEKSKDREVIVRETAPPFAPRGYTPIWGEGRVVRVRELPDNALELVVARELLREEKV